MRRVFKLFAILLLIVGCNEKVIEKPENLIPRDKMVDILFDMALINAGKAIDPNVMNQYQIDPMSYVFRKYEIDSAQFVKSDLYYAAIPLEYEAIYKALEERLEQAEESIQQGKAKEIDTTGYKTAPKLPLKSKE